MNLTVSVSAIVAARKLLTRVRFERLTLPILNHVLATIDNVGLTLAVTDLDHWLETRVPATIEPFAPGHFLIPAEALKAATRSDKGSAVLFAYTTTADGTMLTLTTWCCGLSVKSVYHLESVNDFPARPNVEGKITTVPKETLEALAIVAGCVSTDATRNILNGVYFTPEDGGRVIATDARRLAGAPARVPPRKFVLPTAAVHVLGHPDFSLRDAAIQQPDEPGNLHVRFHSGPHTLIAKTIEGHYPNYRQVIPHQLPESVTIPESHRTGLISWLRSLNGRYNSVRPTWEKPAHLTLTHRDDNTVGATIQVPVTIDGRPPAIAFPPKHLADALSIGATLHLVDHLNPGMTTDPSGNFCLVMNQRVAPESVTEEAACGSPAPAIAA